MKQRVQHIALMICLIFLFNEVSQGLHFLFFHHHGQHLTAATPTLGNEDTERSCPYENAEKLVGEAFSISHFPLLLYSIGAFYPTVTNGAFPVKPKRGYQLRAPPVPAFPQYFKLQFD